MTTDPTGEVLTEERRTVELFGLTIDALTMDQTVERIEGLVRSGGHHQHVSVNVDKVVKASTDPELAAIINGSDVVSADGQPIVWASRLLGHPLPERVAGIDLMQRLIERSADNDLRLYFLGARAEIVAGVMDRVRREHPTAVLAGGRDGYWSAAEEPSVVREIAAARPEVLFLAIPSPAKERFLDRWKETIGAGLVMGVGGSFDVYVGAVPRAPRLAQRLGLEWLFRLLQEPRRMWRRYLVDDMRFAPLVGRALVREVAGRRRRDRARSRVPRLLVVTNLYPSERNPAFGTFVHTRVAALRAARIDVHLAAIRDAGVHRRIPAKYARLGLDALAVGVVQAARGRRLDGVEAHIAFPTGWFAWPVALLHRAPLVLYVHGADVASIARRSPVHRFAARLLFRRATLVVVNSEFMRERLAEVVRLDPGRVVVESPGIDLAQFRAGEAIATERAGLLFVGRLHRDKGIRELLDAFDVLRQHHPALELQVIGDGPERGWVDARAARPGAGITVRGPLPPSAVADAMRAAAVLVMPSTYEEPLGLVALEGMAAGAVVVASRGGGLGASIEDGVTGVQVDPLDRDDLLAGIERALAVAADDAAGGAMRAAAAAAAAEHAIGVIARRSIDRYHAVARRRIPW